ncbi:radical SAM protein [bacterium]|nr:MAG: radical SAM protein [bacterium]
MATNTRTDVLLINPPRKIPQRGDFPPIGLAYISAMLKMNRIKTQVIDACAFSWREIEKILKNKNPSVVGLPCWTVERDQSFKLAQLVKKILPAAKVIVGGHHAAAFPEHVFQLMHADAVVIGEGELTTVELVKALLDSKGLRGIKGIAHREDDKVVIGEPRDFIEDLDTIPFPTYEELNFDEYLGLPEVKDRTAAMITSRGCVYNCIFCSASKFWKRKWRARTAKNIVKEITFLHDYHAIKGFMFFDDNFAISKERAIEICQGILENNLCITWVACSHINHVDKELLSWMKKAGCYRIDYGVESGSPKVLENIKKGQTVEQIKKAFQMTHEVGIKPRAYLMVGNPGDDETTIDETVALMKKIRPYDTTSGQILWVLPDTEIYELAKKAGIVRDEDWLKNDSMVYYTVEHGINELKLLRDRLMAGLTNNKKSLSAYGKYIVRKIYYKYPVLQKLRIWRKATGF